MMTNRSPGSRVPFARDLIIAGSFVAIIWALKLLSPDHLDPELKRRVLGALMGALMIYYANAVPKALVPLAQMRCDPAAEQATRRFVGWSLVLGGVAFSAAWLLAPLESANTLAASFLGATVLLVVARLAWSRTRRWRA